MYGKGQQKGGYKAPQPSGSAARIPAAGQKRPPSAPPQVIRGVAPSTAGRPTKVQKTAEPAYVVFLAAVVDDIGIHALCGDYADHGFNHERKVFRRQAPPGDKTEVYMYYWDNRDGADFSGWWLGDEVGGTQVWSRSKSSAQLPPMKGWAIPWDGPVNADFQVMSYREKMLKEQNKAKVQVAQKKQQAGVNQAAAATRGWEERVEEATRQVATVEIDVEQAIEDAQMAKEGGEESEIAAAAAGLAQQAQALAAAQRDIAKESLAAQQAPATLKAEVVALAQRIRKLQTTLREEQGNMKTAALMQVKTESLSAPVDDDRPLTAREMELEAQHSKQLEEMLPVAMEKVDNAEDEVEKVAIAAAPLNVDSADDLKTVMMTAIKETEQRVRAAQAAIGDARRYISTKISAVQRFVHTTKKSALEEFQGLQTRLNEAQDKLNPLKTARQEYETRVSAKKAFEELSAKLAGAEIEVEKAAMMSAPLGGDSAEGIKETDATLNAAQSALSQTSRLLESKLKSAEKSGASDAFEDVKGLQDRAKEAQAKLDEVRKSLKETQMRVAADTLLKDVSIKVSSAEDEVQLMSEAELPFLRGNQKGEELEKLLKDSDDLVAKVHATIGEAQTFVARKLVEVARFTEGPAKAVREEIDGLQKRLEDGRRRMQEFKSVTAERKRSHLLQDVDSKVAAAEAEVTKMTDAATALNVVGVAGETVQDSLKEALEQANSCERAAQASIVVARKHLVQKTAELKKLALTGAGSGAELGKLQTRVNSMQHEISKLREKVKNAEERVRVKQMLTEVAVRLQSAEAEVDRVAASNVPLAPGQSPDSDQVERAEKATSTAQNKLSATCKVIDIKLKSAEGFLKEELQGMRGRVAQAESKLNTVIRAAKDQKERLGAAELVTQAMEKVEAAEAGIKATSDAEMPFLKGLEVMAAADAQKAVADSEKAATGAQKAVSEARTFVMHKLGEVKQYSSVVASESCTKELLALQKRLDATASKLAELKKDTGERKRRTQLQASGEKVAKSEAALEGLTAAMAKFADDKLGELTAEAAQSACEGIANAEQAAQSSVSEARKFLAARLQESKGLSEGQRGPAMAELSTLQSRLTQCQVELAKLSKVCTEREQKFVAQQLVREAEEGFKAARAAAEIAAKVAEPLMAEGSSEAVLAALRLEAVVDALLAHSQKDSIEIGALFKSVGASADSFAAFMEQLPELSGKDNVTLTPEHTKSVFAKITGGKTLTSDTLKALLSERKVCVLATAAADKAKGGKSIGSVEVGEGIQVLEQKTVDGQVRLKCVLARDGSTVWTSAESEDGPNFKSGMAGRLESAEACASGVVARCAELGESADQKTVELSSAKQGPLAEVKVKLTQFRTQALQEQASAEKLKKQVQAAKVSLTAKRKEEMKAVHEVRCKAMTETALKESTDAVGKAEAQAAKVVDSAKSGSAEKLQAELSLEQLQAIKTASDAALQILSQAKAVVSKASERFDAQKGPTRNLLIEPRVQLTKLSSRANAAEKKCKAATEAVRVALDQLEKTATRKARDAIRAAARKSGKDTDQLFDTVAGGKAEVSLAQFQKFVEKLPDHGLTKEHVGLVFKAFGPYGLRKAGFTKALQEFYTCTQSTAITDKLLIGESSTLRKLDKGEVFEVLEGPVDDAEAQVQRVRGKALKDATTGWVTIAGNQGTSYLKATAKPFMWVTNSVELTKESAANSKPVRKLTQDEVLELLEGPREEVPKAELFLHGSVGKDGPDGWITLRSSDGSTSAALSNDIYVCKSAIAMTDSFDIKDCKVVRKVAAGEALRVIGGKKEDASIEITRLQFKAVKDGAEGWVTLKGNQGTIFAEASTSHYVVSKGCSIRAAAARDAAEVGKLKKGDVFAGKAEPVEDTPATRLLMRARAMDDGASGWVSFELGVGRAPVRPWRPRYTCRVATDLTDGVDASSASMRKAKIGEVFEAIEGPTLDAKSGRRRIRCAADGVVVGWATLRDSDGKILVEVG